MAGPRGVRIPQRLDASRKLIRRSTGHRAGAVIEHHQESGDELYDQLVDTWSKHLEQYHQEYEVEKSVKGSKHIFGALGDKARGE